MIRQIWTRILGLWWSIKVERYLKDQIYDEAFGEFNLTRMIALFDAKYLVTKLRESI